MQGRRLFPRRLTNTRIPRRAESLPIRLAVLARVLVPVKSEAISRQQRVRRSRMYGPPRVPWPSQRTTYLARHVAIQFIT